MRAFLLPLLVSCLGVMGLLEACRAGPPDAPPAMAPDFSGRPPPSSSAVVGSGPRSTAELEALGDPGKPSAGDAGKTEASGDAAGVRAGADPSAPPVAFDPSDPGRADRDFAARLYATQRNKSGNLFFSPASVRVALAMTYSGARGETATQMARAAAFAPDAGQMTSTFAPLLKAWNAGGDPRVRLKVVSQLWGQTGIEFIPAFVGALRDGFGAPLQRLDFLNAAEPSRAKINAWVEGKTERLIKDLLLPGDIKGKGSNAYTRLVLTSAVYFKGGWQFPFAKDKTAKAAFHVAPGNDVHAQLMSRESWLLYAEVAEAKVLSLPYGKGDISMVIALPADEPGRAPNGGDFGLEKLERALDIAWLDGALSRLRVTRVEVSIPRFSTGARTSLKPALSAMGMPLAFQAREADFSGMDGKTDPDERLFIDDVIQKAFVTVEEKGTEAAAGTAVNMAIPVSATEARVFRADRPFVYFIRDKLGNILFMGRMSDPTK